MTQRADERERQRDRMALVNRLFRKKDRAGLAALGLDLDEVNAQVAKLESWRRAQPYAAYELSNLGALIRGDRKRIERIKRDNEQRAKAEAAPDGVLVEVGGNLGSYAVVTFAERPEWAVLGELKAAGFRWQAPSWFGDANMLPARFILPALAGRSESLAIEDGEGQATGAWWNQWDDLRDEADQLDRLRDSLASLDERRSGEERRDPTQPNPQPWQHRRDDGDRRAATIL